MPLSLDEVRSLICATNPATTAVAAQPTPSSRQIVIGERGWVWVGDVTREGGDYVLRNASVIRIYGTTTGLGQLAREGKQPKTILDPCGTIRVPELAVIGRIDVAQGVIL
jgi:hypothetical protein